VQKSFAGTRVIRGVDLEIARGEFVVMVGPSGCGKSTLLRMIAGLEDVSAGDIAIDGTLVNDVDPAERDIAMVFQSYALYPHMTVSDNLAFGLKLHGVDRPEIGRRVQQASTILGLSELLGRYPRELSGGQRQRVAMGRAMVRDPKVFLFDEPLSNLDAKLRVQMRVEIKALHQRLDNTAIYVTHDQVEAMTMADRIVVMRDGRIEQVGPPLEIYDRPATIFVAQFIGSPTMNLFRGRAKRSGATCHLATDDALTLPLPGDAKVEDGQPVVLGIRPEHLCPGETGLPFDVTLTEPLGREILLHGKSGATDVCVAPGIRLTIASGDRISLTYRPEQACVFDAASERNLAP
jgi:multiple sugar transport system ATP-binding protein